MQVHGTIAEIVLPLPLEKAFHYRVPESMVERVKPGVRVIVPFGKKRLTGYCVGVVATSEISNIKDIIEVLDGDTVLSEELLALASWMSATYLCSMGEALSSIFPPALRAPKRAARKEAGQLPMPDPRMQRPQLTASQQQVVDGIKACIAASEFEPFVLHGVTSSGKTEVYLALIEEAIRHGRSAIFLLPEIALTPQFIGIVQNRFPGQVGLWHSRIPAVEKYVTWQAARKGGIKIMLGARSALFAPLQNLGLIVIDEEHEPSYKQEQKPGYQTRDVALERARLARAAVVLGSATPSLEAYYSAQQGRVRLFEMKERIDARRLPPVRIIDTGRIAGKSKILSEPLMQCITRVLARREQAILFLNRRGFAPGVTCRDCGAVIQCPHCSIALVYHSSPASLRCHYCDYRQPWPETCPTCKKSQLSIFGVGTQKVEEELRRLYPQARLFRLDRDTASKKGVYEKVYEDFKKEEYDILLGTQMVVKGFDFPRVTLVGVIDADTALYLPDFRSAERTFQLITQVAGRCGRSALGGEVLVQTRHPEHYALCTAQKHDFNAFYATEIDLRRQMKYPPFSRLVNILVRGRNEERVADASKLLAEMLLQVAKGQDGSFEILGPAPAAHTKLQNYFRWQIILKGSAEGVAAAAREAKHCALPSGVLVGIDVDPQSTL